MSTASESSDENFNMSKGKDQYTKSELLHTSVPIETGNLVSPLSKPSSLPSSRSNINKRNKRIFYFSCFLCFTAATCAAIIIAREKMVEFSEALDALEELDVAITVSPSTHASSSPSTSPSKLSTSSPSSSPSGNPTSYPSLFPSYEPSIHSSTSPSSFPTLSPTSTPSYAPTKDPTKDPTQTPSQHPSEKPSLLSSTEPTSAPTVSYLDFYVFGDIPYNPFEYKKMLYYVENIPMDGQFIVHVGDINKATRDGCPESSYIATRNILRNSVVPLFMTPGDNDWNDCPDIDGAWENFATHFIGFDQHWEHDLPVQYQPSRDENFSMWMETFGTLIIGLNLVGGTVHDEIEWETRLVSQLAWTMELIAANYESLEKIVLFGHCRPSSRQKTFFSGFEDFITGDEKLNEIPILYLHGDGHDWEVEEEYRDMENFYRIQVDNGNDAPPIRVRIQKGTETTRPRRVFEIDQRLEWSWVK